MDYDELVYACAYSFIFDNNLFAANKILNRLDSFEKIFSLSSGDLNDIFCGNKQLVEKITDRKLLEDAKKDVDNALSCDIEIIPITSDRYPYRFKDCPDASPVLFYKGNADLNSKRALGIVGTRRSTYNGHNACISIIKSMSDLSPGPMIVSGLAYGIDECAHKAALECGLDTIAVLPGCIQKIYPAGHTALAEKIARQGGLLSDRSISRSLITPGCFQRRNRIIAGTSDATLIVESYAKGGGLITTSFASSYGRDVYAVPGRFGDKSFEGCNNLIAKNIASLVCDTETIPVGMGWKSRCESKDKKPDLFSGINDPLQQEILKLLSENEMMDMDGIAKATGKGIVEICACMTSLEMEGLTVRTPADSYILTKI